MEKKLRLGAVTKYLSIWGCRKINFLVSLATASLYKIIKS